MKVSEFPTSVRATVLRSSNDVKMMESPSTAAIVTSAKEARRCLSVCLSERCVDWINIFGSWPLNNHNTVSCVLGRVWFTLIFTEAP